MSSTHDTGDDLNESSSEHAHWNLEHILFHSYCRYLQKVHHIFDVASEDSTKRISPVLRYWQSHTSCSNQYFKLYSAQNASLKSKRISSCSSCALSSLLRLVSESLLYDEPLTAREPILASSDEQEHSSDSALSLTTKAACWSGSYNMKDSHVDDCKEWTLKCWNCKQFRELRSCCYQIMQSELHYPSDYSSIAS